MWGLVLVALALYALSIVLEPLNEALATVPGFAPPTWWPPISNPTVEITAPEDAFPDIKLAGNYLFFAVFVVYGIVFNILGEELYYRSMLLPKMRGVFGRWDWVANGILFELKHVYQRWTWGAGIYNPLPLPCWAAPSAACRWRCCCIGWAFSSWA